MWSFSFFLNAVLFGVGLAMDAFSVSLANGLNEPFMPARRMCRTAGTFALFQFIMPLTGWFCVHTIESIFSAFRPFIPWIALALLCFIGGKMLLEGIRSRGGEPEDKPAATFGALLVQGVATSIDALSVGFTIAEYSAAAALTESLVIGAVTFGVCLAGLWLGKRFGTKFAGKASILGGLILIGIGVEILVSSLVKG